MACLQDLLPETASESFRAGLHLVGFQMFYHFVINRFAKRREHMFYLLLPIMIIEDELESRKKPYYREPSMLSLAIDARLFKARQQYSMLRPRSYKQSI